MTKVHFSHMCSLSAELTGFQGHAVWDPIATGCLITKTVQQRANIWATLAIDVALLLLMFVGVLRRRSQSALWNVLYHQVRSI